ncbi:MAG: hypothetical protein ABI912_10680 [Actinomycetota bacterium]
MRTASRVFGAIGLFAVVAAALFAAGWHNRGAIQGTVVLGLFGLACSYLWLVLGHGGDRELDGLVVPGAPPLDEVQHNDPASIHLPGPSIFPLVFALAGGLILIGLLINRVISYAGAALFLLASIGWARQAVGEHRLALAHGDQSGSHPEFAPVTVELAHRINLFRQVHGGATASVQHLGRGACRIVLVGADGEWGDLVSADVVSARQACALAGVEVPESWPAGLGARMRTDPQAWHRMGGHAPAVAHGPRDGYTQTGARVFLAIAAFAFFAAGLFAISGHNRAAIQGTLILAMFGIANLYLYVFMRNARGGPDDAAYADGTGIAAESMDPAPALDPDNIHLPGPSIWPAVFAVSAGSVFIGLVTSPLVSMVGVGLFVLATVGWIAQAVGEYRSSLAGGHAGHGSADDDAAAHDHVRTRQNH